MSLAKDSVKLFSTFVPSFLLSINSEIDIFGVFAFMFNYTF